MNFSNLEEARDYEVEEWLIKKLNLTAYQQSELRNHEFVRFSDFYFFKRKKQVKNLWLRLTIILFPIVWLLLFISLPITFIITGKWGYDDNKVKWFKNWAYLLNI